MSKQPKVWTLRKRKQMQEQRAHQQELKDAARALRRRRLVTAAFLITTVAVFTAVGVVTNQSHAPSVVVFSAVTGLIVGGTVLLRRRLTPKLGRWTSLLSISLGTAAVFLTIAAASPHCPDSSSTGRCTSAELANWSLVGLFLPLVMAITLGTPMVAIRTLVKLSLLTYRLFTGRTRFMDLVPGRKMWERVIAPAAPVGAGTPETLTRNRGRVRTSGSKFGKSSRAGEDS